MRQRITLLQSALRSDLFISAGERHRLEREERDLLWIIQSKADDRSHLIIINAVDQSGNQNDLNARFMQIVDGAHLHVEEIANLAMAVRVVSDTVELQINVTQSCFSSLPAKLFRLGKLDSVRRCLHAVVANLAGIAN